MDTYIKNKNRPINPVDSSHNEELSGITKREYFAAMAMQGMLPNYKTVRSDEGDKAIASLSVKMADALLEELDR